jgi:hypothetical protein
VVELAVLCEGDPRGGHDRVNRRHQWLAIRGRSVSSVGNPALEPGNERQRVQRGEAIDVGLA